MRITILGCGGSSGVPMIGGDWGACDPENPKNQRTRASILVEEGDAALLIDTSPDLRAQLLRENVQKITAVLYTHTHGDHLHGIDDMRGMNWHMKSVIPVYGDAASVEEITRRFEYIFRAPPPQGQFYKPTLTAHVIDGPMQFPPLTVVPFEQEHGPVKSLGYRIGKFAYSIDCKTLPEEAFEILVGIELWVVDCARRREHPTHAHLAQTLAWIERVKPKKAILTHMGTDLDYDVLCRELPLHIRPAYDGLRVEL